MNRRLPILFFGLIEISIGTITLSTVLTSVVLNISAKPPAVLVFVLLTASISLLLGVGLLLKNKSCYDLLIFFSYFIVLSKILIFAGIITLNAALETTIPQPLKNLTSIIYHCALIASLRAPAVKKEFAK